MPSKSVISKFSVVKLLPMAASLMMMPAHAQPTGKNEAENSAANNSDTGKPAVAGPRDGLSQAWRNFAGAQENALKLVRSQPQFDDNETAMAAGYQMVIRNIIDAIAVSAQHNPDYPRFSRIADIASKSGMDNPDTEYRMAIIRGDQPYRITGRVTPHRMFNLQSIGGQPGVGDAGPGDIIDTLPGDMLVTGRDGTFEVIVSSEKPSGESNWLKLAPRAGSILVRYTDSEWDIRAPQEWLAIERLCDDCPASAPTPDAQLVTDQINRAAASLYGRTATWLTLAKRIWAAVPRNGIASFRETQNGLRGQYSAFGSFDLTHDQALIVEVPASDAPYQGIQLASRWFVSMDYRSRVNSLTREQARVDDDRMLRFVISGRDPGVWNWLDISGFEKGLIMLRWQGLDKKPAVAPTARLVKFDEIGQNLPRGTETITAQQRRDQIRRRMAAIDRRYP